MVNALRNTRDEIRFRL